MRIPKIPKSIFLSQFLYMQLIGVLIGFLFPFFMIINDFPKKDILNLNFFLGAQLAGQAVGVLSFFVTYLLIKPHLKSLSLRMELLSKAVHSGDFLKHIKKLSKKELFMQETSLDEVGVSSKVYNELLDSIIVNQEFTKVSNKYNDICSRQHTPQSIMSEISTLLINETNIKAIASFLFSKGELEAMYSFGVKKPNFIPKIPEVKEALRKGVACSLDSLVGIELLEQSVEVQSQVFVQPILFKDEVIGLVVSICIDIPADEKTYMALNLINKAMGLALDNAMSHQLLKKHAAYDTLTKLYNRRLGLERLNKEFSTAMRKSENISIMIIDIDFFKKINDSYGHLAGDKVLVSFARIIQRDLRSGDVLFRYGGEEFMMILPDTSSEKALIVAERVRKMIEGHHFLIGNSTSIKVTTSIGVCCYPCNSSSSEVELIEKADQALYKAKENGRNQSVSCNAIF